MPTEDNTHHFKNLSYMAVIKQYKFPMYIVFENKIANYDALADFLDKNLGLVKWSNGQPLTEHRPFNGKTGKENQYLALRVNGKAGDYRVTYSTHKFEGNIEEFVDKCKEFRSIAVTGSIAGKTIVTWDGNDKGIEIEDVLDILS